MYPKLSSELKLAKGSLLDARQSQTRYVLYKNKIRLKSLDEAQEVPEQSCSWVILASISTLLRKRRARGARREQQKITSGAMHVLLQLSRFDSSKVFFDEGCCGEVIAIGSRRIGVDIDAQTYSHSRVSKACSGSTASREEVYDVNQCQLRAHWRVYVVRYSTKRAFGGQSPFSQPRTGLRMHDRSGPETCCFLRS